MSDPQVKETAKGTGVEFDLKDALSLHKDQTDRSDRLWNYYIVVTLGFLGFILGTSYAASNLSKGMLLGGYVFFVFVNLGAIRGTQNTLALLNDGIKNTLEKRQDGPKEFDAALLSMERATPRQMMPFHLLLDAAVIGAIIIKTLR